MCIAGFCIHFSLNFKLSLLDEILFSFLIVSLFFKWELHYIMSPHCFKCTLLALMFNYDYTYLFYFQLHSVSLHMEETDQHDIQAAVVVQVSHEDSQPTKSYFNQDTVLSTFSATFPVPTNNSTYFSYDHILQNIKCEHNLQENILEENTSSQHSHSVGDGVISGLQSVKCEEQRHDLNEHGAIVPFMDTVSAWTCDVNKLTEVKPEKKTDPDEYDRNSDETRHWVVCQGGELKEVKTAHDICVSDILPDEVVSHNVDQTQYGSSLNHAKLECGGQVTVHERTYTGVECFTCKTCGKSFRQSGTLKTHERTHTGVKPFTCKTCGKSFTQSGSLKTHEIMHSGVKPFTCETCGKSFALSSRLKTHGRTHTGVKPYTCETCGKSFVDSTRLKLHQRTHTGVKRFTCETCGKSFGDSTRLKLHQITHTGVKPFNCDTCGKSFVDSTRLKTHARTHTGVKPFTCEICGKSFRQTRALKLHQRMHTGVKPYTCESCGKSFVRSWGLTTHE